VPLKRTLPTLVLLAAATALAWGILERLSKLEEAAAPAGSELLPVPVGVGPVERGPMTLRRTFSGTLESTAEFVVAPRVAGRLQRLEVDLGDTVARGQVVAYLDDEEFVQTVHQAEADLAVAEAGHSEAKSALEIAERALRRAESLRQEGVASESYLDVAKADELASRARVEVTKANIARAEATLEAARIRLGYARVTADWSAGDDRRVVAQRFVHPGGTVSASTALLSIAELDPIVGVVHVPERDYARLGVGQRATLTTDTHPGRTFEGRVARIAPVFRSSTRQARVELLVDNAGEELKPGMFIRATLELERIEDATIVPFDALTQRDTRTGVFVVEPDGAGGERVAWRPVEVGVRDGDRVEVRGPGVVGRVVTLGQELCDDGARVTVAGGASSAGPLPAAGAADAPPGTGAPGTPVAPGALGSR